MSMVTAPVSSQWLHPTHDVLELAHSLGAAHSDCSYKSQASAASDQPAGVQ